MSRTLNFETGLVEYDLNGACKVQFNPTDTNFVDRFYKTVGELEKRQEEIGSADIDGEPYAIVEFMTERDKEMRTAIDGLLGKGVSQELFGGMNCYAVANGLPVWLNLIFAIADEIADAFSREQEKTDPRIKSYNEKYAAMVGKYKPSERK